MAHRYPGSDGVGEKERERTQGKKRSGEKKYIVWRKHPRLSAGLPLSGDSSLSYPNVSCSEDMHE